MGLGMREHLDKLLREHPYEWIVIANRWNSDYKISKPVSRYKALKIETKFIRELDDRDWKIGVYQLTKRDLAGVLFKED